MNRLVDPPVQPGKANVLVVIGTRPEAIKMLPVVLALAESDSMNPVVISTGQHSHMVAEILALGGLGPDIDLAAGHPSVSLCGLWSRIIERIESFCAERWPVDGTERRSRSDIWGAGFPVAMLVHGDTTSAAAAAVAGFQLRIPVVHVEAGLRTRIPGSPFPEEMNRQMIDRIAAFHLAPTSQNEENLVKERIDYEQVFVTGNTGIDALKFAMNLPVEFSDARIAELVDSDRRYVVVTGHRRENWGGGLHGIATGVAATARAHPDVTFVVSTHPNPAARAEMLGPLDGLDNVVVCAPFEYVEFAHLLAGATFAISDSGGIQEEAPAVGTPVLVARESTERSEGVDEGTLLLVGTDPDRIEAAATRLLSDPAALAAMVAAENPYGDGEAARRIVESLEYLAGFGPEPVRFRSGFRRASVLRAAGFPTDREPLPFDERAAIAAAWPLGDDV